MKKYVICTEIYNLDDSEYNSEASAEHLVKLMNRDYYANQLMQKYVAKIHDILYRARLDSSVCKDCKEELEKVYEDIKEDIRNNKILGRRFFRTITTKLYDPAVKVVDSLSELYENYHI